MAGPVDEEFAERHLRPGSVLEFGCSPGVFTSRIARRLDVDVTGIDLYPAETTDGFTFVQGDVLDYEPGRQFDTILCVSSFEHCGIETIDFKPGRSPDVGYHLHVAAKIVSMLKAGGILIVTCPFGPNQTWLTRDGGEDVEINAAAGVDGIRWGYRTFDVPRLASIFGPLRPIHVEAFAHVGGGYFDRGNWSAIDPMNYAHRYDSPRRCAVMGVVFEKETP